MPATAESGTRTQLQTIALANGIAAGRAVLGVYDLYAAGQEALFANLVASGPLLAIGPAFWSGFESDPPLATFNWNA